MRIISTAALLLVLAAPRVFAGAPSTVAIGVDTTTLGRKIADDLQDGLGQEVVNGLTEVFSNVVKAKVQLTPVSDPSLLAQVRDCEGAECLQELAKSAPVDLVVQLKVQAKKATKKGKGDYTISMAVARAAPARDAWREKTDCQACTGGDVKHMASLLASSIADHINLEVTPPVPEPAPVIPVVTPPPAPPPPAPPEVVATPAAPEPAFYVPRALSIAVLAGGVALAGSGVYLLHLNGRGTCELAANERQCPDLYDTAGMGTGLVIGGGAAVVAGLVGLIFFPPTARTANLAFGLNASSMAIRGTF
jgi:hypothetical protein